MALEWRRHEVKALIEGGSLVIGDGYRAKNDELGSSGLPFARAGNVNGGFRFDDADRFPASDLERVGNKISQPGDVVFTSKGTVGRFGFVRVDTPRFVYSPQLCYWRSLKHDVVDPRFLFFWMHGREFFVQFRGVAGQTDMADYVSLTDQRRMHITLPPPAEQRAIANILGALDDKIELNRRMSETLEAMARALFSAWFVGFDPVRAKSEGRDPGLPTHVAILFPDAFEHSPLGDIPAGWVVRTLGDLADLDKGLSYNGEGLVSDGGLPLVNLGCFAGGGRFKPEGIKRYRGDYRERHVIRPGDLVIANTDMTQKRLIIGSPAFVPQLSGEREYLFSHHTFAVRFKPGAERWKLYVYFALLRPEFREIAEGYATGTTVLALPRDGVLNYAVAFPPDELLSVFERHVGVLLAGVESLARQNDLLRGIRDTLLPKLVSGELRIGNPEDFVGAVA
jgi:type I restriction enzyme S subunit